MAVPGCEGSMGWLWAFIETFVELIMLIFLISVTSPNATKLRRELHSLNVCGDGCDWMCLIVFII